MSLFVPIFLEFAMTPLVAVSKDQRVLSPSIDLDLFTKIKLVLQGNEAYYNLLMFN